MHFQIFFGDKASLYHSNHFYTCINITVSRHFVPLCVRVVHVRIIAHFPRSTSPNKQETTRNLCYNLNNMVISSSLVPTSLSCRINSCLSGACAYFLTRNHKLPFSDLTQASSTPSLIILTYAEYVTPRVLDITGLLDVTLYGPIVGMLFPFRFPVTFLCVLQQFTCFDSSDCNYCTSFAKISFKSWLIQISKATGHIDITSARITCSWNNTLCWRIYS